MPAADPQSNDGKKNRRKGWKMFLRLLFGFAFLFLAVTFWTLWLRFRPVIFAQEDLRDIPGRPAALVFGAGYWPSGALSDVLRDRLDAAIELYDAGVVQKLLFSGDNRFVDYNEPARMEEYALQQGVPQEDIVLDFAGRRTYDSCYRAQAIFEVNNLILVTQRYHLPRALETCRGLGISAIGYAADRTPYVHIRWYQLREIPALWRAWIDTYVLHTLPVLGDPLPIFAEDRP